MANILAIDDVLFRFPDVGLFVLASEGSGDNLLREDMDAGYVDYIDWTSYTIRLDDGEPVFSEVDGGMVLSKKYVRDMSTREIVDSLRKEAGIISAKFEIIA